MQWQAGRMRCIEVEAAGGGRLVVCRIEVFVLDDPKGATKTTSPNEFDLAFFSRVEIASVFKVGN